MLFLLWLVIDMLEIASWTVKSIFVFVYTSNRKITQTSPVATNDLVMLILFSFLITRSAGPLKVFTKDIIHRGNTRFCKTTNVMTSGTYQLQSKHPKFFRCWQKRATTVYLRTEVTVSVYLQVQWEVTCTKVETCTCWRWQLSARRRTESPHLEPQPRLPAPSTTHRPHMCTYCLVHDFSY